jgi:hypothetical protein
MLIYRDGFQTEKHWKEMKIMDKKIKEGIINKILIETDKESAR